MIKSAIASTNDPDSTATKLLSWPQAASFSTEQASNRLASRLEHCLLAFRYFFSSAHIAGLLSLRHGPLK